MQINPLVSVCIPTYNRDKKLKRAVHALLRSTYKNLEVIISDNASSDDTVLVCNELEIVDHRVKYFRHEVNSGPVANFEFARSKVNGKYFMWHNDDDFLDPNYIEVCVNWLEADPTLTTYSGVGKYFYENGMLSHTGNIINCTSKSALLRVIKDVWSVGENSIFYGLHRVDRVKHIPFPNIVAVDWAWMIAALISGRALVTNTVFINREFENTTSSSPQAMVSTQGLPSWYGFFPWIAHFTTLTQWIARIDILPPSFSYNRYFAMVVINCVLFFKCIKMSIVTKVERIAWVKTIYRRHFKGLEFF